MSPRISSRTGPALFSLREAFGSRRLLGVPRLRVRRLNGSESISTQTWLSRQSLAPKYNFSTDQELEMARLRVREKIVD
jgi:hypothetical protein